jgi:hypothetical protein
VQVISSKISSKQFVHRLKPAQTAISYIPTRQQFIEIFFRISMSERRFDKNHPHHADILATTLRGKERVSLWACRLFSPPFSPLGSHPGKCFPAGHSVVMWQACAGNAPLIPAYIACHSALVLYSSFRIPHS